MSVQNKQKKYSSVRQISAESARFDRLDALRGFAMLWMTVFHFCFDLNYFGYLNQNFYEDIFWIYQRSCIVSLFLICAGLGQAIALSQNLSWSRFWKRWKQVAGAAILVTIGSYIEYPNSFIYFGVLHAMAVMLIIMRVTAKYKNFLWFFGFAIILLKFTVASLITAYPVLDFFNSPFLNWIGIISYKPRTEDYVPLIPWLGVMWIGLIAGLNVLNKKPDLLKAEIPDLFRPLAVLGRYSLSYYLVHQPVLFGLLYIVKKMF